MCGTNRSPSQRRRSVAALGTRVTQYRDSACFWCVARLDIEIFTENACILRLASYWKSAEELRKPLRIGTGRLEISIVFADDIRQETEAQIGEIESLLGRRLSKHLATAVSFQVERQVPPDTPFYSVPTVTSADGSPRRSASRRRRKQSGDDVREITEEAGDEEAALLAKKRQASLVRAELEEKSSRSARRIPL